MTGGVTSGDGTEHYVSIRSVQVWKGGFDADMLNDDGERRESAEGLDFHREKSLSFECECGRRFLTWETATEHLRSVETGTEADRDV